ncbi:chromate transporter [Alcaligenaceae bacterium]|nr:chromate transporter [Alcaligenaceae bacterium]
MIILLLDLISVFAPLSLLTIGGGQSIIPAIHSQAVDVHQWMSNAEFIELFALSRLTPGPKTLLVTMIGWHVGGFAAAITASIAIFLPSSVLMYYLVRLWARHERSLLIRAISQGLAPVAAGMVLAGTGTILRAAEGGAWAWAVAIMTTVCLLYTRLSPLLLLALGGVVFVVARP